MTTLTVATLMKLAPPVATKLIIDYVLGGKPLPDFWTETFLLPQGGMPLLLCIAATVVAITTLATLIHLSGRWYATRTVSRMQAGSSVA